jgi:hypothetical protein
VPLAAKIITGATRDWVPPRGKLRYRFPLVQQNRSGCWVDGVWYHDKSPHTHTREREREIRCINYQSLANHCLAGRLGSAVLKGGTFSLHSAAYWMLMRGVATISLSEA